MSQGGCEALARVTVKSEGIADSHLEFRIEGDTSILRLTNLHPVATERGWVQAGDLTVGDLVKTREGSRKIVSITVRRKPCKVYDISVQPGGCFFANGVLVHNKSVGIPPVREELAGDWVGHVADAWHTVVRLSLDADGKGLVASTNGSKPARLYVISSWRLDKWKIEFALHQVEAGGDIVPLDLHGKVAGSDLIVLDVTSQKHEQSWDRNQVRFRREQDVEADLKVLRERMERFGAKGKTKGKNDCCVGIACREMPWFAR